MKFFVTVAAVAVVAPRSHATTAFVVPSASTSASFAQSTVRSAATLTEDAAEEAVQERSAAPADGAAEEPSNLQERQDLERRRLKRALLGRLGVGDAAACDPVLADPQTKAPLSVSPTGPIMRGGSGLSGRGLVLRPSEGAERVFTGRTDTYINLLEPASTPTETEEETTSISPILSSLLSFAPPPLRSLLAKGSDSLDYVPMRDLFTSPSVSFAYERGWRQGFAAAGFPGADKEYEMAREYFAPAVRRKRDAGADDVLVDMSCATGLFTRRFAKSNDYSRVIACDYSDSMLSEARRRIRADPEIADAATKLELVRCDVGRIPMTSDSVDAFHAGAAMHCWPEIEASLAEIHRVLVPGGRYFATTFLGNYFSTLSGAEKASNGGTELDTSMQAFQYFPSKEHLEDLLMEAGFEMQKIDVEILGSGCAIMRCEK